MLEVGIVLAVAVAVWFLSRSKSVVVLVLLLGGFLALRKRDKTIEKVLASEKKAVEEYGALAEQSIAARRQRLAEKRIAEKRIEEVKETYAVAEEDRADRIADLWAESFGRPGKSR